jgi:hypothetical protein
MLPIEDFRNGFHVSLTEDLARKALMSLELPPEGGGVGTAERLGLVSAVAELFPKLDFWQIDPYKEWLAENQLGVVQQTAEWNGYYAARFAVAGAAADLAELVRRAKHRDGSAASVAASSAALSLLVEAASGDEEILARIRGAGLDLYNVRFGNHPAALPGPEVTIHLEGPNKAALEDEATLGGLVHASVPARASAAPAPAAGPAGPPRRRFHLQTAVVNPTTAPVPVAAPVRVAAPAPVAAPLPAASLPWGGPAPSPNSDAGDITFGGAHLSITAALNLCTSLGAAARALLLPVEGCAWVDDRTDPAKKSELVILDPVLAEGLPPSVWDGALAAELLQSADGVYQVKVYDRSGGSTYVTGSWLDMNDAKAAAAERMRPELQKLLGQ